MSVITPRTVELDVRPHLRKKLEPFQIIMDAVKELTPDDTFVLHATFKPTPLLGVMKMRGYSNEVVQLEPDHWIVTFRHKKRSGGTGQAEPAEETETTASAAADGEGVGVGEGKLTELDNRGLEPPQPMVRTLHAFEKSKPGDRVRIHNDRVPMFLIEELKELPCKFDIEEQPDGSAIVTIYKL